MAFVDELEINISAGKGGDGVVRWRHEKNREYGGPAGGDGGKGGSVYAKGVRDIGALFRYRATKDFRAHDGGSGKSNEMRGADGEDLVIDFPVGSIIINRKTQERFELLHDGEQTLLLAGGAGGLGNAHFKGSYHQRPKESTPGKVGEDAHFHVELQLIADVGFVGLPNAGKSSLLNALTRANAKIGSYAFTTLEPNLGVMDGYVLADIPGLIEGAAQGKGLGHKFLRHIKRTKVLLHLISLENPDVVGVYETIRTELEGYDQALTDKKEIIVLTKTDTADSATITAARQALSSYSPDIIEVSILNDASIQRLRGEIARRLM